jgi:hypothetical protein
LQFGVDAAPPDSNPRVPVPAAVIVGHSMQLGAKTSRVLPALSAA